MLKSLAHKTKVKIFSSLRQASVEAASLGRVEIKNSDYNPSFLGTGQEDGQGLCGLE